jgi:hypothetical protein
MKVNASCCHPSCWGAEFASSRLTRNLRKNN